MPRIFENWYEKAFNLHRFDVVVKLGGSVAYGDHTEEIRAALEQALTSTRCLVFPGGGVPDALFEEMMAGGRIDGPSLTRVTNLALDQTAFVIAGWSEHFEATDTVLEATRIAAAGRVPVLAPSRLLAAADVFRDTDRVSSDSMAAWLAHLIRVPRLTLVKSRPPCSGDIRTWFEDGLVDEVFADLVTETGLEVDIAVVGIGADPTSVIAPAREPSRWRPPARSAQTPAT